LDYSNKVLFTFKGGQINTFQSREGVNGDQVGLIQKDKVFTLLIQKGIDL
jgi:hypothetical protein